MSVRRSITRSLLAPIALTMTALTAGAAFASPLGAQGRQLFQWNGRVEREMHITMRGFNGRASTGRYEARGTLRLVNALPRDEGHVLVRVEQGRADVDVVQQPSARNGYTAIVRVRDFSRRDERIRLAAFWRPENEGWMRGPRRDDSRGDERWEDRDYGSRTALRWSGEVDSELEIRIRGNSVRYHTPSGDVLRDVRVDASRGIPREEGEITIASQRGRGSVTVVEQPSARNGYTAVIRVRDPQGGYGQYDFDVLWRDRDARRRF